MATRKRKRRKRRRRLSRGIVQCMMMFFMCLSTVVGATIFFKVETITVEGNAHYTAEEIIRATEIEMGSNLFTIPRGEISEKITYSLPYVQSIAVKLSLPTGLRLVVEEQKGMVQLVTSDSTWYMGVQGKLLEEVSSVFIPEQVPVEEGEVSPESGEENSLIPQNLSATSGYSVVSLSQGETVTEEEWVEGVEVIEEGSMENSSILDNLPTLDWNDSSDYVLDFNPEEPTITVTGIELFEPVAGQQVQVAPEDSKQLKSLLALFKELETHNLFDKVTSIHVHMFQHFEFYFDERFWVKFPLDGDYSYKLRALVAAVSETEKYETGIMDLTHAHYAVLFTPN